jgi:hypothetical protein
VVFQSSFCKIKISNDAILIFGQHFGFIAWETIFSIKYEYFRFTEWKNIYSLIGALYICSLQRIYNICLEAYLSGNFLETIEIL